MGFVGDGQEFGVDAGLLLLGVTALVATLRTVVCFAGTGRDAELEDNDR